MAELKVMFFDELWGSDESFQKYKANLLYYNTLGGKFTVGLRGVAGRLEGMHPFMPIHT